MFKAKHFELSKIENKINKHEFSTVASSEKPVENKRRPLKAVIKEVRERGIESLEDDYKISDKKRTTLVFPMAKYYLKHDVNRAKEILDASAIIESKFMLLQI